MPSRLAAISDAGFAKRARASEASQTLQGFSARGTFLGIVPDIDGNLLPPNAARSMEGLIVRPNPVLSGQGEVLRPDDGYGQLDSTGTPGTGYPLGADAATVNDVVLLAQFPRTNSSGARTGEFDVTQVGISGGDGSTAGSCEIWRISPVSGDWTEVTHSGAADSTALSGDRDSLPDWCVMQSGAPSRASSTGAIDEPAMVICSDQDPVMVFPAGTGVHTYEEMVDSTITGLDPFYARTCAVYGGRVYYGNTSEAGTRYRQRIRRTPAFTCDPDPSGVGAGAFDLREDFSGALLRLEPLGDVLVAYFEDGVAFIRDGGPATNPNSYQVITTSRGLLATHGVVNIGNNAHFGVFTDGMFYLTASGQFQEVGLMDINGETQRKWHYTFYSTYSQDPAKRGRLYLGYDQFNGLIRMAIPTDSEAENEEVWIYDMRGDRMFRDRYPVTCWGSFDRQVSTALAWSAATDSWATIIGSWDAFGATYGSDAIVHGNVDGHVLLHDPGIYTRDDGTGATTPSWFYATHERVYGSSFTLKTFERLLVEYHVTTSTNMSLSAFGTGRGSTGGVHSQVAATSRGTTKGIQETAEAFLRAPGQMILWSVSGSHPVLIRAFEWEVWNEGIEPRE